MFLRHFQSPPPELLLIHGLFGHTNNLRIFADILNKTLQQRISSVDLRNHGQSIHGPMTFDHIRNDINPIMTSPMIVCGHSLGGKVVMDNMNHPNIKAGVILDMSPRKSNLSLMKSYLYIMLEANLKYDTRQALKDFLMSKINNIEIVQFLMTNLRRSVDNKWEFQLGLQYLLDGLDAMSSDISTSSNKPMLFIKGSESDYIKEEDEIEIKALYPNATIKTVKGSHWVHFISPQDIANLILKFKYENK